MGGRLRVPRIEGHQLAPARDEELRRAPGPGEAAVEGKEVSQVLAEQPPPALGVVLERRIVTERQGLEPARQRDQPLGVEAHLGLPEARPGLLGQLADPVRGREAGQEGGGLADPLPAGEGPVEEVVDLALDAGRLDRRVAEERQALLEGERPLELEPRDGALLIEDMAGHGEPERAREVEEAAAAADRARERHQARPRLRGQRQQREDPPLHLGAQPGRCPSIGPERVICLGGLGVECPVVAVPGRRLGAARVEERPHGGDDPRAVEPLRHDSRDAALALNQHPAGREGGLRVAPRAGRIAGRRRAARPAREPTPSRAAAHRGRPVAERQDGGELAHGRGRGGGRTECRQPCAGHRVEERGVAVWRRRPLGETPAPARLAYEDDLERDPGRQPREQAVERSRHRLPLLGSEELGVEERKPPREPDAAIREDMDRVGLHPAPGQEVAERRGVGVERRDRLVRPRMHTHLSVPLPSARAVLAPGSWAALPSRRE